MSDNAAALAHLRTRLQDLQSRQKRRGGGNLPHWSNADMEAVETLLYVGASKEQIALARIEGLMFCDQYELTRKVTQASRISRNALGLGAKPR